jgi:hypothetical protein
MSNENTSPDGWVRRRVRQRETTRPRIDKSRMAHPGSSPDRWVAGRLRLTSKWVLMRGLLEEIEKGSSLTRLYAGLLAQAMLDQDAKLRARYGEKL